MLKKVSASLVLVSALVLSFSFVPAVHAQTTTNCDISSGSISEGAECVKPTNSPSELFGPKSVFMTVTNVMLFVVGAVAVVMLIVGGIRYVVSAGDQAAVTGAKNTIMYAIIGIVVAFLAYAAVNFVSGQLQTGTSAVREASTSNVA